MTASVGARQRVSDQSLWLTALFAVLVIAAGWLIGWSAERGDVTTVTLGNISFELPDGWFVVEQSDERALATEGLAGRSTLTVSRLGEPFAPSTVGEFLEASGSQLVLFSVDSLSSNEAVFRYVNVDEMGKATEVMLGRVVLTGAVMATVYTPMTDFTRVSRVLDDVVESLQ